jgi:S-formylglutathione hydrolase FrmB
MRRAWLSSFAINLCASGSASICAAVGCWLPMVLPSEARAAATCAFEVSLRKDLRLQPEDGRLFVVLARTNQPEPRLLLGHTGDAAPPSLARDVKAFGPGASVILAEGAFGFPVTNFSSLRAGDYFAQALFDFNRDLRSPKSPGNFYSAPVKIRWRPTQGGKFKLELIKQIPPEELPADSEQIKFLKFKSSLLTQCYGRPIFLRAGIVLPRDYGREPSRRYPLWVRIGGLNTRFTTITRLMAKDSDFRKTWLADGTPRFILLQLDGAGPYGDPYQVNSANNGPYGDALIQELIPFVEASFRALGQPSARVLSGISTGGWVALALQVFYPDFFNGAWAACPDPVDFRALQLLNIYEDDNAYLNRYGCERPSARDSKGDVTLTMREEVGIENLLGRGNSYTLSGEQWGAWNTVFGPRGADGLPVPLWDPQSGKVNHTVAQQWRKYDLRLVLEQNWKSLGPKLRGKLHIAAGEADQYFLNNAVHLLDEFLSHANPPLDATIVYGPGKAHGWTDLSLGKMLQEMQAATEAR